MAYRTSWRLAIVAGLALVALGLEGCAHPRAQTEPTMPALAAPPPPPHEVPPNPAPAAPAAAPQKPAAGPVERSHERAPSGRRHPESTPSGAKESGTAAPPPMTLETAPATNAETREIRGTLARASRDLARVDYQSLSSNARAQYDTAKRFIRQAEDALTKQNFTFARSLADKAAVLAALLRGGV